MLLLILLVAVLVGAGRSASALMPEYLTPHMVHFGTEYGDEYPEEVARGVDIGCVPCHPNGYRNGVKYDKCGLCHSPGGYYNGLHDDPNTGSVGALDIWGMEDGGVVTATGGSAIYDENFKLRPGKEQWCLGCHDDGEPFQLPGFAAIAPNVSGLSMVSGGLALKVHASDMPNPQYLIDGNTASGTAGGYVVFDLGESRRISHITMITKGTAASKWAVYGGNDAADIASDAWAARILFGNSIIRGGPCWDVGSSGTYRIRMDRFRGVRYVKIKRLSPGRLSPSHIREISMEASLQYGYCSSGHKMNIACTECHDVKSVHIDWKQRTFRVDESQPYSYNPADLQNYENGYRLKKIMADGTPRRPLVVPRPSNPQYGYDFVLCFNCHEKANLFGTTTNFRNSNRAAQGQDPNLHKVHLLPTKGPYGAPSWDADRDGIADSRLSCVSCHNVHGSPSSRMLDHGELISTNVIPEVFDKSPALNMWYIGADNTRVEFLDQSRGGRSQFYGSGPGSIAKNHVCHMCHNDGVAYYRDPVPVPMPTKYTTDAAP